MMCANKIYKERSYTKVLTAFLGMIYILMPVTLNKGCLFLMYSNQLGLGRCGLLPSVINKNYNSHISYHVKHELNIMLHQNL